MAEHFTYGEASEAAAKLRALSDAALVAHLLDVDEDVALRLLCEHGGLNALARSTTGAGQRFAAAAELGRRLSARHQDAPTVIHTAEDVARVVADMAALMQEEVRALLLDSHQRLIAVHTLYTGTAHATLIRTAEVYRPAILHNTPAMILVHNHPSGDPSPSPEDVEMTRTLVAAGSLLDISLLDHVIIGGDGWLSLRELRLGFH